MADRYDNLALVFESHNITRDELEKQLNRLSAWLRIRVNTGAQIALYLPNSPALVVFFLAGVRAGCEMQVFDHQWPAATVLGLLAKLSPALLITDQAIGGDQAIVVCDAPYQGFNDIANQVGAAQQATPQPAPAPNTVFYTGFTSGSTGTPKGFRRTYASWLASFKHDQAECPLYADDRIIAPGALSHSLFLYALLRGVHAGIPVIICRRFSAHNVARVIALHGATVLYSVPAQIGTLIQLPATHYTSVRRVFSSGAKWPPQWRAVFDKVFCHAELCEFYGASELSFVAIAKASESPPAQSVGRAFRGVTIRIKDARGNDLPAGETGQVFVESDMVFLGYAGERCVDGVHTALTVGDRGYLDNQGFLFLRGRVDRMIVSSGKNIYPEEIEQVLLVHPGIDCAAVIGVDDDKRGQRLVAVVKGKSETRICRADLLTHCRNSLPPYKVPRVYAVCETWPLTRSGKTDNLKITEAWYNNKTSLLKLMV